ncbi:PQQ-dependent sugar dehydrogenase [Thiomicrospira microaerophila]|uniref:PQQ-dependent sugar dehydrogenase n=1 Tax=Thiomicrospira microaerophila TaxID=406020 RepID=UPI00200E78CD|nr:PQQ-dependent sugar dehydrogenase [Thiomicrospira microaerophila]UQB42257.1 PQQ-dependent sugar dehydrogenase [Thiomicrospira microaerophila]
MNISFTRVTLRGFLIILLSSLMVFSAHADKRFHVEHLATGLGVVWGMDFVSEHQLVFTQRSGEAGVLDIQTGQVTWLAGLPAVAAIGQGGLLDVKFLRNDGHNQAWLYFTYSYPDEFGARTALARAQLPDLARLNQLKNWQDLLISESSTGSGQHFGSRIAFDDQGYVFFGVGDRGERQQSQNTANHIGTIMRLHLDGRVPKDNPFVDNPAVLDEIWSFGHRNPQGMAFDFQTGRLWSNEHGPRGGDEINLIQPGENYGWPLVSQGKEYWGDRAIGVTSKPGMVDAVKVFTPSIAPGSLLVYRGEAFPQWQGSLFSGALALRHLNRVTLNEQGKAISEERLLTDLNERIRSLSVDLAGLVYFSTDSGKIARLRPID